MDRETERALQDELRKQQEHAEMVERSRTYQHNREKSQIIGLFLIVIGFILMLSIASEDVLTAITVLLVFLAIGGFLMYENR